MNDYSHVNDPYVRGEGGNAGKLFRGEQHLSASDTPVSASIPTLNGSGDIVGNPAYQIPGNPALINSSGVWAAMPARVYAGQGSGGYTYYPMQNPDGYIYYDRLLYRSDLTAQRDSPNYRSLPSSPTTPGRGYRFLDGRRGDVYG
jgi:hypothetical protein